MTTTYFKGDKAEYTGNVIQIHGGTFYEVTMLEGIHQGELKVVKNAPAGRTFDDGRKSQGFKSQAHLDAFYAHYDHVSACQNCKALNGFVLLNDGMQPTQGECEHAQRLYVDYLKSDAVTQ